jgi:3-hydroxymyristoyl/3-hydroxydecanoyl-(acyl carrier protein) dehydratase
VRAEQEAVLISSPAYLKRLPEYLAPTTTNRFRAVFSSGGPLSLDTAHEVKRLLGFVPIEVFGSSETGGIAWRQQHARMSEAWTPMPGVTWRICSDEGVLEVRSPHLPDQNWFRTADRAVSLGEHHFLVTGRFDRIVKIEGKRVSLSTIESGLTASPMVANARVIVMEGRRQQVAAFIVPSISGRNRLARVGKLVFSRMLRKILTRSIEPIGIPRIWRYLDALPTNAQGKTSHAELIALLDDEQSRAGLPLQHLVERESHRAVLELSAPRDLCYFNGHFPGMPVLAGVVQIHWAITYGRQYFDLPPVFRGIHGLKLQRIIGPEEPFTLELIHEPTKSSLLFKFTSPVGSHSSGRAIFGATDV